MADILFLIAGIVLFFKKSVRISSKRTISGRPVKILAVLYVLPGVVGFIGGIAVGSGAASIEGIYWVTGPLVGIAILATLYFIFFQKGEQVEVSPSSAQTSVPPPPPSSIPKPPTN